MLTVWDVKTSKHTVSVFLHTIYYWMTSSSLLVLMCSRVNVKPPCSPGCQFVSPYDTEHVPLTTSELTTTTRRWTKHLEADAFFLQTGRHRKNSRECRASGLHTGFCMFSPPSLLLQRCSGILFNKSLIPILQKYQSVNEQSRSDF